MADDDGGFSFDDIPEDGAPVETPAADAPASVEPTADAPTAAAADGAPEAATEDKRPVMEDDHYRKPVTLYKHWVRPKFLQYDYLYDYRLNYYDDVLDYVDKKARGLTREIPRAQYWAERVLRTYTSKPSYHEIYEQKKQEREIQSFTSSIKFHNYHTRAYINRKYSAVL